MDRLFEQTTDSRLVFKGRVFSAYNDKAMLYNGKEVTREVVRHNGGVCVAPVDGEGRVYLVRQFRYPLAAVTTELPAGKLEQGEDPDDAIRRELHEETGFTAERLIKLAVSYPSPGFSSEVLHLYLATGLTAGEQCPDDDEFLDLVCIPLDDAVKLVAEGQIRDGKTQTLLLMAQKYLREEVKSK